MTPTEFATSIKRGTDWCAGVRLYSSQGVVRASEYVVYAKILNASRTSVLKTIPGFESGPECFSLSMSDAETTALEAQKAIWEIWSTRTEDDFKQLLNVGRATIF